MLVRKTSVWLFIFFLFGLALPSFVKCKEKKNSLLDGLTQWDMQCIPTDLECMLLSKHTYTKARKPGERVVLSKKDLLAGREDLAQEAETSYIFFGVQLILICLLLGWLVYDFLSYVTKQDTWSTSIKKHLYFGLIAIIKLICVVALAMDLPLSIIREKRRGSIRTHGEEALKPFYDNGWRVLRVFTSKAFKGYKSILYINEDKTKLVLALRGSANWRDWWYTNLPAVMYQQPEGQVKLVLKLLERSILEAKKHGIDVLTITGHSLGGFVACVGVLQAAMHFREDNIHVRAVTYDAPGAKAILERINCNTENNKVRLEELDITTYVASANFINSLYDHTGSLYMTSSNDLAYQVERHRFPLLCIKLLFYVPISLLVQGLLQFIDKAYTKNVNVEFLGSAMVFTYYALPMIIMLLAGYLIYVFNFRGLVFVQNLFYSQDYHSMANFIGASNPSMGNIEALEVRYFPKYGQAKKGFESFFLGLLEDKSRYMKHIKETPIGICYVKSDKSKRSKFLPFRHILPKVCSFLRALDKKYTNGDARDVIFRLLGVPICCVYDSKGVFQGIESAEEDLDVYLLMDRLAFLLRENNYQN